MLTAACYHNGVPTSDIVTFAFGGASPESYGATVTGNSVTIECFYSDAIPLTITAQNGSESTTAAIALTGW
jgi:7-keto-8-aminopelargonate synthetase-like enzyme